MDRREDKLSQMSLHQRLDLLQDAPERGEEAARRAREHYLAQVRQLTASQDKLISSPVSQTPFQRLKEWIDEKFSKKFILPIRKERFSMITTLTTLLVAAAMLFGGAGATVYAAQESLPTDFLYPVKTFSENLRLQVAGDSKGELALAVEFAARRLDEVVRMLEEGENVSQETLNRLQEQMAFSLQLAAQREDAELRQALEQIRANMQNQEQRLLQQQVHLPDQVDPVRLQVREMLQEQIRLAETGLEDPVLLRQELQQQTRIRQAPSEEEIPDLAVPAGTQNGPGGPAEEPQEGGFGPGPGECEDCIPVEDGSGPGPGPGAGSGERLDCTPALDGSGPGPGPANEGESSGAGTGEEQEQEQEQQQHQAPPPTDDTSEEAGDQGYGAGSSTGDSGATYPDAGSGSEAGSPAPGGGDSGGQQGQGGGGN